MEGHVVFSSVNDIKGSLFIERDIVLQIMNQFTEYKVFCLCSHPDALLLCVFYLNVSTLWSFKFIFPSKISGPSKNIWKVWSLQQALACSLIYSQVEHNNNNNKKTGQMISNIW